MITGFNTDVKYGDTVYHVQTEDKGVKNPLILSLIYVKGAILDAFRIRYQDFLDSDRFSEALLQKILEFQHRQIVGAIKRGKYQKGMILEDYVAGEFVFSLTSVAEPTTARKPEPAAQPSPASPPARLEVSEPSRTAVPAPVFDSDPPALPSVAARSNVTPADSKPGRLSLSSLQAAEPVQSASQALLAVDISEVSGDQGIEICVEGAKDFFSGEQVDLQLYVQSRQGRMRLENVQVVIKLIGTTFSPRLYAGKTDRFGCLSMNFSLPTFSGGSAALIIQVSTSIGNDEVKYLVRRRR
ncbi:MAG: hypothetical protein ACRD2L_03740 [Terriglobia bacterium]